MRILTKIKEAIKKCLEPGENERELGIWMPINGRDYSRAEQQEIDNRIWKWNHRQL